MQSKSKFWKCILKNVTKFYGENVRIIKKDSNITLFQNNDIVKNQQKNKLYLGIDNGEKKYGDIIAFDSLVLEKNETVIDVIIEAKNSETKQYLYEGFFNFLDKMESYKKREEQYLFMFHFIK
jgi:hypothetical protein